MVHCIVFLNIDRKDLDGLPERKFQNNGRATTISQNRVSFKIVMFQNPIILRKNTIIVA